MTDKNEMIVRKATEKDVPFLITAIIEADKSGSDKSSYCSLLEITDQDLRSLIERIFSHQLEGFEFCISSFCILENLGRQVGACASWIEELDGIPSWQSRMLSIREESDVRSYAKMLSKTDVVSNLIPTRTPLSLQIESVFIDPDFRGKGLFSKMLQWHVSKALSQFKELNNIEMIVYDNNLAALNSYLKSGFTVVKKTAVDKEALKDMFPSTGMLLLSKNL